MRLLFFILIVLLGYLFLRKLLKDYQSGRKIQETDTRHMVRCAYCGVFLPEGEALTEDSDNFCCREHRELAKRDKN